MKKLLLILLIAFIASAGAFANGDNEANSTTAVEVNNNALEDAVNGYFANMPSNNYKIGQKDIVDMVIAGKDMVILDIRQADVYGESHLKGAINVPWGNELYNQLKYIPRDKEVFINCYSGQTAGQAVALLNIAGINARSINLGWNFGISKVEGLEAATETEANFLDTSKTWETDPQIDAAYKAYYAGLADVKGTTFGNYKISEDNAKKIIDSGDTDVKFLSIRQADAYAEGHIATATNLPWGKGMNEMFASLPADQKIVVYCYSGQTAGQAVAGLKLLGYDAVSMNGGMGVGANAPIGWTNKGYPVVK